MDPTESKITSKGQISVPAAVRRRLGLAPGARIEWSELGGEVVVRRASRYSSQDIHDAIFNSEPESNSIEAMDEGIRRHLKQKHARR